MTTNDNDDNGDNDDSDDIEDNDDNDDIVVSDLSNDQVGDQTPNFIDPYEKHGN